MGAILKMRFTYSEIAKDNFSEALREKATQVWNNAISAYLQAVANIVAERQDTGMSLASLFPAIRDMQAKGGEINEPALNTRRDSAPWYMDMQGVTHRGQRKTAAFGERLGDRSGTQCF